MKSERKRRIEILIEKLKERNIYLYGAGIRGKVALENLNILGYEKNICGFVDDNGQKEWVHKNVIYLLNFFSISPERLYCNIINQ